VEQFFWPQVVAQVVTVVAFFGFFLVLVLAWFHGERGRQRVRGTELLLVAGVMVVAGVVLANLPESEDGSEPLFPVASDDDRPSIAVLPFYNDSPDPDDAYFADGMQDEIISKLSKVSSLKVLSRSSTEQYRQARPAVLEIAEDLDVDFVLEGSARLAGSRVRLIAQLIDARQEGHVWSDEYDRSWTLDELFEVQSEVAEKIASSMKAAMTPEEITRMVADPTQNLEAYRLYILGRHYLYRRVNVGEALDQGIGFLRQAVGLDPDFAQAHASLAYAYSSKATVYVVTPPQEWWPLWEAEAREALRIDSTLAEAHYQLASFKMTIEWDWDGAEASFQRALEYAPDDAEAHQAYSWLLMVQGRIEEALWEVGRGVELEPNNARFQRRVANRLFFARRYDESAAEGRRTLELDSNQNTALWFQAWALAYAGSAELAFDAARRAAELGADSADVLGVRAGIHALEGDTRAAQNLVQALLDLSSDRWVEPYNVWAAYALLGDRDLAFEWLERSLEVRTFGNLLIGVTPWLDPVRDDPRYQAILDRIGLGHLKERFDSLAATDPSGGT
jgi:TolB-like protein/Tfp pilus assembly protein PilF